MTPAPTTTWYRIEDRGYTTDVYPVDVIKESASTLTYLHYGKPQRCLKKSEYYSYFKTRQEALLQLIKGAKRRMETAEKEARKQSSFIGTLERQLKELR